MDHLLLFGHSHATCVAAALQSWSPDPVSELQFHMVAHGSASLPGALVVEDANRNDIINPILLKAIETAVRLDPEARVWLVSMAAGNYAAELSMFAFDGKWGTLLPGEDAAAFPEGVDFVHYDAIRMTLGRKLRHFQRFLAALPMSKLAGFIHVEAPPPVRDPAFMIGKMPEKSRSLAKDAGIGELDASHIADAGYRRRVWLCQFDVIRESVEGDRRHHLGPPPDAIDHEGFIREDLRKDPSHANHLYGRLILEQLAEFVLTKRRKAEKMRT